MDLSQLLAQNEIMRLKARYCQYLDQKRWDDFATLFAPDAELRTDHGSGLAVTVGRDAIVQKISSNLARVPTMHYATNPDITVHNEGEASGSWCVYYVNGPDGRAGLGWYDDRYVRVGGQWVFKVMGLRVSFFRT